MTLVSQQMPFPKQIDYYIHTVIRHTNLYRVLALYRNLS